MDTGWHLSDVVTFNTRVKDTAVGGNDMPVDYIINQKRGRDHKQYF